jgi:hypothetical protein
MAKVPTIGALIEDSEMPHGVAQAELWIDGQQIDE